MPNELNILFTGDFAPCRRFEKVVLRKKSQVFGDSLPLIQEADISFVNLECPVTTHGKKIEKDGPAIKAEPKCIEALKDFSVIGLANNHVMDFDKKGLEDTLKFCKSIGLPFVGAGIDLKEALKFYVVEKFGFKIAFIALAEHEFNQADENRAGSAPIDAIDNYHQIMQAKEQADMVIVTLHAGNEYFPYPRPNLRKLCNYYIDLGVEAVVCTHPHVPGAYEYHNNKPIFYSIGNLIFDTAKPCQGWDKGYMVSLKVDIKEKSISDVRLFPYTQSFDIGGLKLLHGKKKERFLNNIESYRKVLKDETSYKEEWQRFVSKQADRYIFMQYSPFLFRGIGMLSRHTPLEKLLVNKRNVLKKLNILRCQSHYELLKASLESKND